jgi:hypothetical protein
VKISPEQKEMLRRMQLSAALMGLDVARAAFMAAWPTVMEALREDKDEDARNLMHSIETTFDSIRGSLRKALG